MLAQQWLVSKEILNQLRMSWLVHQLHKGELGDLVLYLRSELPSSSLAAKNQIFFSFFGLFLFLVDEIFLGEYSDMFQLVVVFLASLALPLPVEREVIEHLAEAIEVPTDREITRILYFL